MGKIDALRGPPRTPLHVIAEFADAGNVKYLLTAAQAMLSGGASDVKAEAWMMEQSRLFMDPFYASGNVFAAPTFDALMW